MSRGKAIRVEHLGDVPLDKPGMFLRIERRWWADGTSCLDIRKWGTQPNRSTPAPWWPPQYTQIPWVLAGAFVEALAEALAEAGERGGVKVG